ncbi:hypothetical protein [Dictyobacter arantiisoli]|uniref:Uncharacterized protein n=1 Tax=Dictyobacter arantiisoli TaxID=2014874 RepID=A0A5A5TB24_9CHLR|nr:hypothetical protein [Dictyobacter arantiisoli]GCF08700.1 hypothetical protein KDI_22640 [Dictyobacter arantiisoli]
MLRPVQNSPVLLAGWLFADLFLGLMVIFLAAIPGVPPPLPAAPPRLIVSPLTARPSNEQECSAGNVNTPRCVGQLMLSETSASKVPVKWSLGSDISDTIHYSYTVGGIKYTQTDGTIHPGETITIHLSAVPCQNGSFMFTGTANAAPVTAFWKCTARPDRLETSYKPMRFANEDTQGLLDGNQDAINKLKHDIEARPELRGRRVGLVIVEAGTDDNNVGRAQNVANKVYALLGDMGRKGFAPFADAVPYQPLFNTAETNDVVLIDVYLFKI